MKTGSHRVQSSEESSASHPALPEGIEDEYEEDEFMFDDLEESDAFGMQYEFGGESPWGAHAVEPESRELDLIELEVPDELIEGDIPPTPPHSWERVVGLDRDIIVFRVNRDARDGSIKRVVQLRNPRFKVGQIILDMTESAVAMLVTADGEVPTEMTEEMLERYKNSYLYLVRKLAQDGNYKQFLADVEAMKKGRYRRKRKLKKKRKR
jgi:hypothetical protein